MKNRKTFTNPIALAIAIAFSSSAQAVGTGQIVSGSGSINTIQNDTVINQNTDKMVINWNSMDIGKNETVQFNQPTQH